MKHDLISWKRDKWLFKELSTLDLYSVKCIIDALKKKNCVLLYKSEMLGTSFFNILFTDLDQ